MSVTQDPILYHVSKMVEMQGEKLDEIQKEVHSLQVQFLEMKSIGQIITPRENRIDKIKDRAAVGTLASSVSALITALLHYFVNKA